MIIDVSKYQGVIDWPRVKAAGVECAIIKATGAEVGSFFTDSRFAANWKGAKDAGIVRGAYHFLNTRMNGMAQADYYLRAVADVDPFAEGDMLPVVDCEYPKEHGDIECVRDFVSKIMEAQSAIPIIYTGKWWWEPASGERDFAKDCPLWLASYGHAPPTPPAPWASIALWQNSDAGNVDGITGHVDTNIAFVPLAGLTL